MWLLKTADPAEHERMHFLMSGDTSDLRQNGIAPEIAHVLQREFRVEGITLEDICRYMGIKRTNANRTKSKYRFGIVLYPIYPLMNSHCHCNTRCDISDKDLTLEIRAQVPIKAGEEVRELVL